MQIQGNPNSKTVMITKRVGKLKVLITKANRFPCWVSSLMTCPRNFRLMTATSAPTWVSSWLICLTAFKVTRLHNHVSRMETGRDIYVTVLKQNSSLSEKPRFLLTRPSRDCMRPTHIIKGTSLLLFVVVVVFSWKLTLCRCYSQNTFTTTPKLSLAKLTTIFYT